MRPARDDKVVAAWNGWLVDSLVQAAMVFDRPEWLAAATEAAEAVWRAHWLDGRLRRASRDGQAGSAPGILEDYAALTQAAVRLAAATGEPRWLERAEMLLAAILDQFAAPDGGFYDTAADAEQHYTRLQDPTDNATPSGLSAAIHALALIAELTGEPRYADWAEQAAQSAGGLADRAPRFAGWLLADAVSRAGARTPVQVAIVGPDAGPRGARAGGAPTRPGRFSDSGRRQRPTRFRVARRPPHDQRSAHGVRVPALRLPAAGHLGRRTGRPVAGLTTPSRIQRPGGWHLVPWKKSTSGDFLAGSRSGYGENSTDGDFFNGGRGRVIAALGNGCERRVSRRAVGRWSEQRRSSSASDDDVGGFPARCARKG